MATIRHLWPEKLLNSFWDVDISFGVQHDILLVIKNHSNLSNLSTLLCQRLGWMPSFSLLVYTENQLMAQHGSWIAWTQHCCQWACCKSCTQWPACYWSECCWTGNKKSQTLSLCPGAARHQIPSEWAASGPQTHVGRPETIKDGSLTANWMLCVCFLSVWAEKSFASFPLIGSRFFRQQNVIYLLNSSKVNPSCLMSRRRESIHYCVRQMELCVNRGEHFFLLTDFYWSFFVDQIICDLVLSTFFFLILFPEQSVWRRPTWRGRRRPSSIWQLQVRTNFLWEIWTRTTGREECEANYNVKTRYLYVFW